MSAEINDNSTLHQTSVEKGLRPKILIVGNSPAKMNILDRMSYYKVPGVSIALVNNNITEWSKGYGHVTNGPNAAAIDEETLFQAGSVSKPVTAFGALLLVQQGEISLDEDVNHYLKRWKVPENEFTNTEKVTLRRLLSHTAGTNVSGFPGYSRKIFFPTIIQILQGKKPFVNTEPVIVVSKPGTEMKYSGGGTTIVQLLIEDITGERFDVWMRNNVLKPLDMLESTFSQPLPASLANHAAFGHHLNGVEVKGQWHNYPEMAAAGLWTTPDDLAKFMIYIQGALRGDIMQPLRSSYVKKMITRQKIDRNDIDSGLGFFLENQGKDLLFSHNGQDEGFITLLSGYAYRGQGVVIMMNNDSGWALMNEITNSIADTYHWPNYDPIEKKTISVDPTILKKYVGNYFSQDKQLEINTTEGKLFIDFKNGNGSMQLFPTTKCHFFIQQEDVTIEFLECQGKPDSLVQIDPKGVKSTFNRKK